MKSKLIIIGLVLLLQNLSYSQELKVPAPSPKTEIKQEFGLSQIELSYSRPSVKGRVIFGDLLPYGKFWRTGANSATTITFGSNVKVNGIDVKAGKYSVITFPNEKTWTIVLNSNPEANSPTTYDETKNVAKFDVNVTKTLEKIETFTISINNITSNSCKINITWENTNASFEVTTDIDTEINKNIEKIIINDSRPYFNAAMYYLENNKDLTKALEWFEKAEKQNDKAFWVVYRKAVCLQKLGKKKEAKEAAEKSKALATEAKNDDYVALNDKLLKELK